MKFSKLEKRPANKLAKLIKQEHGNLNAICEITCLNPKTVKAVAKGERARVETIEKLRPILFI
jgi:hypothetical protein